MTEAMSHMSGERVLGCCLSLDTGQRLSGQTMEILKIWDFCLSSIISVALDSVLGVTSIWLLD